MEIIEKACEAVANTVRQETQKEDIKILDDYSRWLSAPERTADKKLRDYAVRRLGALKEKFIKSAKATVQKVTNTLQEPEHRQKNLEQVREKAPPPVLLSRFLLPIQIHSCHFLSENRAGE